MNYFTVKDPVMVPGPGEGKDCSIAGTVNGIITVVDNDGNISICGHWVANKGREFFNSLCGQANLIQVGRKAAAQAVAKAARIIA